MLLSPTDGALPAGAGGVAPSWEDDEDLDDPGHLATNDPLTIQCRRYPAVHEWLELLNRLVCRTGTLVELSQLFLLPQRVPRKRRLANQLLLCCKAIDADLRHVASLDSDLLVAVLKRRKGKRAKLGGKCGMDAAIHVGRWLVHLFGRIGNNETPQRFRWTQGPTYTKVSWKRLALRRRILAEWISKCLHSLDVDQIGSNMQADIAWLCARQPAVRRIQKNSAHAILGPTQAPLRSYEEERSELLAHGHPDSVKAILDAEGNLKSKRFCLILQAVPDESEVSVPTVLRGLAAKKINLHRGQVEPPARAMKKLGFLCNQRLLTRTPLGRLFAKNSSYYDDQLRF